jgi:hypothetical protein
MHRSDFIFKYRVRNWPEYNKALIRRGSLTFWVDEQAVSAWRRGGNSLGRGRPPIYTDTAIECALVVRAVFHLSLRATQGFLESVVRLMAVDLPVPAYSTVCRRQAGLHPVPRPAPSRHPRHVVIDSTGLKVFGAGEWYVRMHGIEKSRRRTWRKLHLCVDETSKDIVAVDLTTSEVHDGSHLPTLLDAIAGELGQVSADTACDSATCYEAILVRGAVPTIPPRCNTRFSNAKDPPVARAERDAVLHCIKERGRYAWRTSSGATRQRLAENAVSRFKVLVGDSLASRTLERQQVEALVKSQVLNRMAMLGMPRSERLSVR